MSEKIYIGIDDKRIEAKGDKLDYILEAQSELKAGQSKIEAEQKAKQAAQISVISKLEALGFTKDEIASLKI
jgi:hypothetical protein